MEILKTILKKDKEAVLVWHELPPGVEIREHVHEDMDEHILLSKGDFITILDGKEVKQHFENELGVIFIPRGSKHAVKNGSETLNYYVIRTH